MVARQDDAEEAEEAIWQDDGEDWVTTGVINTNIIDEVPPPGPDTFAGCFVAQKLASWGRCTSGAFHLNED